MAHSFGKLLYHVIFSTKLRRPTIEPAWRDKLYGYIHGIAQNHIEKGLAAFSEKGI